MSLKTVITDLSNRSGEMLKKHLADFTDAELFARPAPGANHPAWQLAHLARNDVAMAAVVAPNAPVTLPPIFTKLTAKESAPSNEPADFPTRGELLTALDQTREAKLTALASMSEADLEKPAPEKFAAFAPTIGHLLMMGPLHLTMHIGQFQVARRALNKPVLF